MKTIFLLGGFGFIGSNVLRYIDTYLLSEFDVIVFDKTLQHPFGIKFNCVKKVYNGDFADSTIIQSIFDSNKIDYVFHFVSSTVPATSNNMRFDIESNLIPTVEILQCMVKSNIQNIVYLSSGGAIYGNSLEAHREIDNNIPISSYGIVKLTIEKYLLMFSKQHEIKPLILRLSNPYGPLHYSLKQGVANVALRSALENKLFTIWGDGNGKKDYIYIFDVIQILFILLKLEITNEILNVGSGQTKSVNEIVKEIFKIIPTFKFDKIESKMFDVSSVKLDITKLINLIGNFEFTVFEDGLRESFNWLCSEQSTR